MNKEVRQLKENGEYCKGAILLLSIKPGENPWDDAALAYFLRKSGRTEAALAVCRKAFPFSKDNGWFQKEYALAIYKTVDWLNAPPAQQVHALKALTGLRAQDWMLAHAAYHTAKSLYTDGHYNEGMQILLGLRDTRMEPELLNWVRLLKLKFMNARRDYPAILAETEAEAAKCPPDPFILRERAAALRKTGKSADALHLYLNRILPVKDDWYIFSETASLFDEIGQPRAAAAYFALALLKPGQDKMKIKAMEALSKLLKQHGHGDRDYFLKVATSIRLREGWKLPQLNTEVEINNETHTRLAKGKAIAIFMEYAPLETGKVTTLGPGDAFCFVQSGKDTFFCSKRDMIAVPALPKTGEEVQFMKVTGYDRKKNRFTQKGILTRPSP